MSGSQSHSKRPRLRFGLRTLLAIFLLTSVLTAWCANEKRAAESQHRDVAAIVGAGGLVWYDYEFDKSKQFNETRPEPRLRRWLRRTLGDDYFRKVHSIDFNNPDEEMMARIANLKTLKRLWVVGERVDDNSVGQLNGLNQLEWLSLDATNVSDKGMERLKDLPNLRVLSLSNTQVSDHGMEHIRQLTGLQGVYLCNTNVSALGFQAIRNALSNCKVVGP